MFTELASAELSDSVVAFLLLFAAGLDFSVVFALDFLGLPSVVLSLVFLFLFSGEAGAFFEFLASAVFFAGDFERDLLLRVLAGAR